MTIAGFQIEETIDRETSGELEKLLLAIGNEHSSCLCTIYKDYKWEFGQKQYDVSIKGKTKLF